MACVELPFSRRQGLSPWLCPPETARLQDAVDRRDDERGLPRFFCRRNLQPAALAARNLHCASTPQVANTADFAAKRHGTVVATPLRTFAYGSSHEPQS